MGAECRRAYGSGTLESIQRRERRERRRAKRAPSWEPSRVSIVFIHSLRVIATRAPWRPRGRSFCFATLFINLRCVRFKQTFPVIQSAACNVKDQIEHFISSARFVVFGEATNSVAVASFTRQDKRLYLDQASYPSIPMSLCGHKACYYVV